MAASNARPRPSYANLPADVVRRIFADAGNSSLASVGSSSRVSVEDRWGFLCWFELHFC